LWYEKVQELAQYFSAAEGTVRDPEAGGKPVEKRRKSGQSLLSSTRLNNVGIVYTFFRKCFRGPDDIIATVLTLNRERMAVERLNSLLEVGLGVDRIPLATEASNES